MTICLPSSAKQPSGVDLTFPKAEENALGVEEKEREDLANRDSIFGE